MFSDIATIDQTTLTTIGECILAIGVAWLLWELLRTKEDAGELQRSLGVFLHRLECGMTKDVRSMIQEKTSLALIYPDDDKGTPWKERSLARRRLWITTNAPGWLENVPVMEIRLDWPSDFVEPNIQIRKGEKIYLRGATHFPFWQAETVAEIIKQHIAPFE